MTAGNLSIVIPALDAAATLPGTLVAVRAWPGAEIVVADGGSNDATVAITEAAGAKVVRAPRGRGAQLAAGAAAAHGDWLLFLHADSVPEPGWVAAVAAFIADPANAMRAGAFALRFDDPALAARRLERIVVWRTRCLGLPYGDQGLLIAKTFYDSLGGFRPLVLMEDVDLAGRIGKRRLALLPAAVLTSAVRYRREGWYRRPLRNLVCLALYYLGLPPRLIARVYG